MDSFREEVNTRFDKNEQAITDLRREMYEISHKNTLEIANEIHEVIKMISKRTKQENKEVKKEIRQEFRQKVKKYIKMDELEEKTA